MAKIKNIFGYLYIVYFLIIFISTMFLVLIPTWLITFLPEPARARTIHPVFRFWRFILLPTVFCPVIRKGKQNFKKGEQYVVVLNHNSFIDILVSSPMIPEPNKTLAKIELSKIPFFGIIYKSGSILLDRKKENSRRESVTKMQETLDEGTHLCLYPEGTRNKTPEPMLPFFDGAFITAIKAQKPILPGVIFNTKKILPYDKKFWGWPSPIQIHFLPPIPTIGLTIADARKIKEKVHEIMVNYYMENINSV
jgi:1-acyl-sn-glycerol-3-phosphate acyltransferase